MNNGQHLARIGAVAAIGGSVIAFIATALHPMSADPNDPAAAFAEYAADSWWVGTAPDIRNGSVWPALPVEPSPSRQASRRRSPASRPWR